MVLSSFIPYLLPPAIIHQGIEHLVDLVYMYACKHISVQISAKVINVFKSVDFFLISCNFSERINSTLCKVYNITEILITFLFNLNVRKITVS